MRHAPTRKAGQPTRPSRGRLSPFLAAALLFAPAIPPPAAAQTPNAQTLKDYFASSKAKYRSFMADMREEHVATLANYRQSYTRSLEQIERQFKESANLDGVLAVRSEQKRFSAEQSVPESALVQDPEELRRIQVAYRAAVERAERDLAVKTVSLTRRYDDQLKQLQTAFTQRDLLEQAIEVKSERDRIDALPEVVEARQASRVPEPDPGAATAADSSGAGPGAGDRPLQEPMIEQAGAKIYTDAAQAPNFPGRRIPLHFTNRESRAAASSLSGTVLVHSENTENRTNASMGYHYRHDIKRIRPRLEIRVGADDLGECTALFEYYSESSGHSRSKSQTHRIPLPELRAYHAYIVDAPHYDAKQKTYYVYPSGRKYVAARYNDPGDFVVSVFKNSDGSMVFQRCTSQALEKYAPLTLPRD